MTVMAALCIVVAVGSSESPKPGRGGLFPAE